MPLVGFAELKMLTEHIVKAFLDALVVGLQYQISLLFATYVDIDTDSWKLYLWIWLLQKEWLHRRGNNVDLTNVITVTPQLLNETEKYKTFPEILELYNVGKKKDACCQNLVP